MGANKFATMLHKNTNKITMILIYAVLEWTLIVLLLLNSLFSYLIIKFARYFGLTPPCLWCSRVDHIFEPGNNNNNNNKNKLIDLLCEAHAKEISKLGYCSNHQKLAESQDMCEDCFSSKPEFHDAAKKFTFFGTIQTDAEKKIVENGHLSFNCSCCSVALGNDMYNHIVFKPSWDVSRQAMDVKFIREAEDDEHFKQGFDSDMDRSDFAADGCTFDCCFEKKGGNGMISDVNGDFRAPEKDEDEDGIVLGEEKPDMTMKDEGIDVSVREDASLEYLPQHLEFFIDCSGHRLVPIELIDSATEEEQTRDIARDEHQGYNSGSEDQEWANYEVPVDDMHRGVEKDTEHLVHINKVSRFAGLESIEIEEDENSLVFYAKECAARKDIFAQEAERPSQDTGNVRAVEAAEDEDKHSDTYPVLDDIAQIPADKTEEEVSIVAEIPASLNTTDDNRAHGAYSSQICSPEDPSTSSSPDAIDVHDSLHVVEHTAVPDTLSVEVNERVISNRSSICWGLNEIEEEKDPDTPTSIDSFHHFHKKLLLLEKKASGTEDSVDGSVISELEGCDGVLTVERLKSALRAERKALHALYAELEEERNASAVAANQTMAMINRLQEEKAAMQMEALQYQRMMEEQAEYDQEALQLLNDLMVKREKEKEELEKELELLRTKVLEYETKENMTTLQKYKDGGARSEFSSPCSNAEDGDATSIDLNQAAKEGDSHCEFDSENTPVNAVLSLEESIADFEEERLSILEQLKVLEEKLVTLDDEHLQHFEDVLSIERHKENGHLDGLENSHTNGFMKETNGKYHPEERSIGPRGTNLLPLFDATSNGNGDIVLNGNENGFVSNGMHKSNTSELENKGIAMEEELYHLYERLQALEADGEFLKHCINSINKRDKGMHLLHEILQHLRDLRNVDLRVRNLNDDVVV